MHATLGWFGCATFRLTLGEVVIFLDAYLDRVPSAPRVGLVPERVECADWIVVGRSHFDHLYGAERIAKRTGARILGSHETVRVMEAQGVALAQIIPVAGGERVRLADGITVDVYPSQHSCVWSQGAMAPADEVCIGDLGLTWQEQQERFAKLAAHFGSLGPDVAAHLRASAQGPRGDGGALVYHFRTPAGSLFYQDTSGHWSGILRDLRPDVAILAAAGRGNVDGEPIQGSLRAIRRAPGRAAAAAPRVPRPSRLAARLLARDRHAADPRGDRARPDRHRARRDRLRRSDSALCRARE
jgi:hypothetical protein